MSGNESTSTPGDPSLSPRLRVLVVVGIALLAGLVVWFLTGCNRDGNNGSAPMAFSSDARIIPGDEVSEIPGKIGHTVFWAGDRPDAEVEMSDDPSGNVHLRYLTDGSEAGSADQTFLDIGTYPFPGAYQTTRTLASQENLEKVEVGNGIGFYDKARPYSVILAFPNEPDLQVEVYHPEKNGALDVVTAGDIVPVP